MGEIGQQAIIIGAFAGIENIIQKRTGIKHRS